MRARDAAGNLSANSGLVTFTTTGGGGGAACRVRYVPNSCGNGFTAELTVTNTGTAVVNGWSLVWSFANGQRVTQMWNATFTQPAATVTATNLGYNATIAPSASVSFGFQGTHSGTNTSPAAFTLNGNACTIG